MKVRPVFVRKIVTFTLLFSCVLSWFSFVNDAMIGSILWGINGVEVSSLENGDYADIASDGAGGMYIVWEKDWYEVEDSTIKAQRLNASGQKQWGEGITVATEPTKWVQTPKVISDGGTGMIVAWMVGFDDIYVQKFDSDGDDQWTSGGVHVASDFSTPYLSRDDHFLMYDLVSDGSGGVIVVWSSSDYIKAQRIDSSGSEAWLSGGIELSTVVPDYFTSVRAISDGSGGVVAGWAGVDYDGNGVNGGRIYGQRVDSLGVVQWTPTETLLIDFDYSNDNKEGYVTDLRLASDGSAGAFYYWALYGDAGSFVSGQRVDSSGSTQWASNIDFMSVPYDDEIGQRSTGIIGSVSDGSGGSYLAYSDMDNSGAITIRRLDATGADVWASPSVGAVTGAFPYIGGGDYDYNPIVGLGDGSVMIMTHYTDAGLLKYMQIQRIDSDGNSLWSSQSFRLNSQGAESAPRYMARLVADSSDPNGLVLWSQGNYNYTFRAQKTGNAYQVENVDSSTDALSSSDLNIEYGSNFGIGAEYPGYEDTLSLTKTDGTLVSKVDATLDSDKDWTGTLVDSDSSAGKAVVYGLEDAPGAAATHTLYIPKISEATNLYICPNVSSLGSVTVGCTDGYTLSTSDPSVSRETVGIDFWVVSGLTGTGGMDLHATSLNIEASDTTINEGASIDLTVTALNDLNNTETGYTGTVNFSVSPDTGVTLPSEHTFDGSDAGTRTFGSGATFSTAGTYTITVDDGTLSDTVEITVSEVSSGDSTPPSTPGTPSTKSPTADDTPRWTWTASTDNVGLASPAYTVMWCKNSSYTGCSSNTASASSNSYTHSSNLDDGKWYFRAKAKDTSDNESSWSSSGSVEIDTDGPDIENIKKKFNGTTIEIRWDTDEDGTTRISWKSDGGLSDLYESSTYSEHHDYGIVNAVPGEKYKVTLSSKDELGNPSDKYNFTVTMPKSGEVVDADDVVEAKDITKDPPSDDEKPKIIDTPIDEDNADGKGGDYVTGDDFRKRGLAELLGSFSSFVVFKLPFSVTGPMVALAIPLLLLFLFNALPFLLNTLPYVRFSNWMGIVFGLLRKKKSPWGIVFDSVTKQPLDPVILTLTNSEGKVFQAVSDLFGRYEFLVEPGVYKLSAQKTNYAFPSNVLAGHTKDGVYEDLYFGGDVTVQANAKVDLNIPMDLVSQDWNQEEKTRMGIQARGTFIYKISLIFFVFGLLWSVLALVFNFNLQNVAILGLYLGMALLRKYIKGVNPWGVVSDSSHMPISGAVIRLLNMKFPTLKGVTCVTRTDGRYNFLVYKGTYKLVVEFRKPDGTFERVHESRPYAVNEKFGSIGENIIVS